AFSLACFNADQGQVIVVYGADYGRRDRTTCINGRPDSQLQNVSCSKPTNIVATRCNGKNTCDIRALNSVFGDPCPDIYKYLEVAYRSRQSPQLSLNNKTVNELSQTVIRAFSLSCFNADQGQVIVVYGADYGRRDRTTCINGRPDSQLQNVSCSKPTNIVATRCNGKNTCDIRALNSVFGDPCPDIYKYLEVAYRCKCE
uniref:SUEL-type lectin domain-containing protein n=1 Tax=Salarias fasciatus TaxID=181472 RepID=A0A672GV52_SALFA